MTTTAISFPKLGWSFEIPRSISLFGFEIYFYALFICAGLILAYIYCSRRVDRFGLTKDTLLDGLIIGVPVAIVGARLWYCLFAPAGEITEFLDIFRVRNGGLAIYGAIFSIAIFLIIFCRIKKLRLGNIFDMVALGFLIGQILGRWGNFVNGEVYGVATALPWGMRVGTSNVSVHPLFFYEILWNLAAFLVLNALSKRRKFPGEIGLLYMAWYGLGRGWMEGLRDSKYIETLGTLPIHQIVAFTVCAISVFVLIVKFIEAKKLGTVSFEYVEKAPKKAALEESEASDYQPMYAAAELVEEEPQEQPKEPEEPEEPEEPSSEIPSEEN